jgi:hypothetical protein
MAILLITQVNNGSVAYQATNPSKRFDKSSFISKLKNETNSITKGLCRVCSLILAQTQSHGQK